jgi:ketosteroid isomerase-like protein
MKRFLLAGAMVLASVGVGIAEQANPVAKALMDLEQQWVTASKASNGDALAALLSDDFVALDSDGTMHNKAAVVARTKKAKWVTNEIGDLKVAVHGDSAVVTGSWTGKGTDGNGKAVDARERWADTWVKMADGKWRCVASASAPTTK